VSLWFQSLLLGKRDPSQKTAKAGMIALKNQQPLQIVKFQNANKHWRAHFKSTLREIIWRAHLERSFGEHAIASLTQTPNGPLFEPQRTPTDLRWSPDGAWWILDGPQLLWKVSSKGLSMWVLQCLFTFWNITISDCNSNYRTRAIITRGLYTFYPLFEVHLCTVTFGLMYG
jgi:hypothetical protein